MRAKDNRKRDSPKNNTNRYSFFFQIISLFTILIIIAGCSGIIKPKKDISKSQAHTGTAGLDIQFLKNAPPNELQVPSGDQRMPFQVGLEIENKGAHDVKTGYLLLNVEKNYMQIMGWQLEGNERFTQVGASGEKVDFRLNGRSEINPTGQLDDIFAALEALPFEKESITRTASVGATICYDYSTLASADVCIDADVFNTKSLEKTCAVKEVTLSGGQGAPISVDRIDVSVLPNNEEGDSKTVSPQFVIYLSNKGQGLPFNPDKIRESCSSSPLQADDINVVNIDDISFSGYSLKGGHFDCNPSKVKLRNQDDKFVCRVKKGVISADAGTYSTTLQVSLNYGYSQSISKTIIMNRLI